MGVESLVAGDQRCHGALRDFRKALEVCVAQVVVLELLGIVFVDPCLDDDLVTLHDLEHKEMAQEKADRVRLSDGVGLLEGGVDVHHSTQLCGTGPGRHHQIEVLLEDLESILVLQESEWLIGERNCFCKDGGPVRAGVLLPRSLDLVALGSQELLRGLSVLVLFVDADIVTLVGWLRKNFLLRWC